MSSPDEGVVMSYDKERQLVHITIPIRKSPKLSDTGKSYILGTTGGFQYIEGTDIQILANIIRSKKDVLKANPKEEGKDGEESSTRK